MPPARRRPPLPSTSRQTRPHRAPLPPDRRPFVRARTTETTSTTMIPPQNDKLKEIRRLQRQRRGPASSPRARTSSRPPSRPGGRRSTGSRPASTSSRRCSTRVCGLGSGTRVARRLRAALRRAAGPLCVALWGVRDPGNVGAVLRSRARVRCGERRARARTAPTRSARRRSARRWARSSRPVARVDDPADAAGALIGLAARAGAPLAGPARRA